jgi:hypothetical protein
MNTIILKNDQGNEFFRLHYDEKLHLLHAEWLGFIGNFEQIQEACRMIREQIEQAKISILLNDNRSQIGPWPHFEEAISVQWVDSLYQVGLKFFAHIMSKNMFAQISAQKHLKDCQNRVIFQYFKQEEDAKQWLIKNKIENMQRSIES